MPRHTQEDLDSADAEDLYPKPLRRACNCGACADCCPEDDEPIGQVYPTEAATLEEAVRLFRPRFREGGERCPDGRCMCGDCPGAPEEP